MFARQGAFIPASSKIYADSNKAFHSSSFLFNTEAGKNPQLNPEINIFQRFNFNLEIVIEIP